MSGAGGAAKSRTARLETVMEVLSWVSTRRRPFDYREFAEGVGFGTPAGDRCKVRRRAYRWLDALERHGIVERTREQAMWRTLRDRPEFQLRAIPPPRDRVDPA